MDMMEIRRRVLMGNRKKVIDTSPKIAEYGCYYRRHETKVIDTEWCFTEWIDVLDAPLNRCTICDAFASQYITGSVPKSYLYFFNDGSTDHYYGSSDFSFFERGAVRTGVYITSIAWSLKIENLDKCYAYLKETGQIFFAGKDSPYYGYTNINDMPQ